MKHTVGDEAAKITPNNAVPCGAFSLVKLIHELELSAAAILPNCEFGDKETVVLFS